MIMTIVRNYALFILASVAIAAAFATFMTFSIPGQRWLDQFGLASS
jgi:hypothetical protein